MVKIAAKDEIFVTKKTKAHNKNKPSPKSQSIPHIKPIAVATPLPPLNFNQTGKIWPVKQIKAEYEIRFSK